MKSKADLANPDFSGEPSISGKAIATEHYVDEAMKFKADLANPNFSGAPSISGEQIATKKYVQDTYGGFKVNNKPLSDDLTLTANDVGAVEANLPISGGTHCKITYDHKGLVQYGQNLDLWDIPWGLVGAGNGISVSRNSDGEYVVRSDAELVGVQYPGGKADRPYTFSSEKLTSNYQKGEVQLLFLRLCQSQTNNSVDLPIDLLFLMKNTGQQLEIWGEYSGVITMQVTDCRVVRTNKLSPYMDFSVTIDFDFTSRGGDSDGYVKAEWWARRLEHNPGPTGY